MTFSSGSKIATFFNVIGFRNYIMDGKLLYFLAEENLVNLGIALIGDLYGLRFNIESGLAGVRVSTGPGFPYSY